MNNLQAHHFHKPSLLPFLSITTRRPLYFSRMGSHALGTSSVKSERTSSIRLFESFNFGN